MKKYIKASFDNWIPDWLESDSDALMALSQQGIDLKSAVFYTDKPDKSALPIYYIGDYKYDTEYHFVWIPGVYNDDYSVYDPYSDKRRRVKAIAKKKLPILDTVYIIPSQNQKAEREHYRDPRYMYNEGTVSARIRKAGGGYETVQPGKGTYSGQIFDKRFDKWTDSGAVYWGREQDDHRDKSGYTIPNPKKRLLDFYESDSGAEALKQRIQNTYSLLVETKNKLFEVDFSNFGEVGEEYWDNSYDRIMKKFSEACKDYRLMLQILDSIKENRYPASNGIREIYSHIKSIKRSVEKIDKSINEGKWSS